MTVRAAFFDMDGVLADSLGAHLRYCRNIAEDFGIDISIPSPEEFKYGIVRKKIRISPMYYFFRALDFSESDARRADERYKVEFGREPIKLFDGVPEMLSSLSGRTGVPLGIATSNVRNVVASTLGKHIDYFRPDCIFADDDLTKRSKTEALEAGADALGLHISELLFVGDQPADHEAAVKAGARFLGVTYGWGISAEDTGFDKVDSPGEIIACVV